MSNSAGLFGNDLLQSALAGNREALGVLLEQHRAYLKLLARRYLGGRMEARVDESDLAQQTCLSAVRHFDRFRGRTPQEFAAWLQKIHERKAQNALRRHLATAKRAADREESLDADLPAVETASPSQRVMQGESAVQLAQAMERLPDDQREAVRLRYLEGLPLDEVAREIGKSRDAAVGLVKRGILSLRNFLT